MSVEEADAQQDISLRTACNWLDATKKEANRLLRTGARDLNVAPRAGRKAGGQYGGLASDAYELVEDNIIFLSLS